MKKQIKRIDNKLLSLRLPEKPYMKEFKLAINIVFFTDETYHLFHVLDFTKHLHEYMKKFE